jgi:dihydroorotate dehydrogenase
MATWRTRAYRAVRPLLFSLDPERVHHLALALLESPLGRALAPFAGGAGDPAAAPTSCLGLTFRNRIGLGAGFDKDGEAIRGWAALGFGFVELGTVTPRPQAGNQAPRLFRLPADAALINRMGFNNAGADALARRIAEARPHLPEGFVVGVSIGRNRNGDADDYPAAARALGGVADYLAINVSSPNTPGLRQLQDPDHLRSVVDAVAHAAPDRPLLVKLSPDLSDDQRTAVLDRLDGSAVAGLILSNTTVTRPDVRSRRLATEEGGLSGQPLLPSTLRTVTAVADRDLAIVASGGVGSGDDVAAMLAAGADLVQLWTGMIYAGPGLIGEAVDATRRAGGMARRRARTSSDAC